MDALSLDDLMPPEEFAARRAEFFLAHTRYLDRAPVESGDDPPAPPPADIHRSWMGSRGLKANLLGEAFREVGVSVVKSKKGTYYYTLVFARAAGK